METTTRHVLLSAVVFPEGDGWAAVCLEHYIAAQGPDKERASHALICALAGQIRMDLKAGRPPFQHLRPAPERYWRLFDPDQTMGVMPVGMPNVPPAFVVQAVSNLPA
jgi:hypothetical protein